MRTFFVNLCYDPCISKITVLPQLFRMKKRVTTSIIYKGDDHFGGFRRATSFLPGVGIQVRTLLVDLGSNPESFLILFVVQQGQFYVPQCRDEITQLISQTDEQIQGRPMLQIKI